MHIHRWWVDVCELSEPCSYIHNTHTHTIEFFSNHDPNFQFNCIDIVAFREFTPYEKKNALFIIITYLCIHIESTALPSITILFAVAIVRESLVQKWSIYKGLLLARSFKDKCIIISEYSHSMYIFQSFGIWSKCSASDSYSFNSFCHWNIYEFRILHMFSKYRQELNEYLWKPIRMQNDWAKLLNKRI